MPATLVQGWKVMKGAPLAVGLMEVGEWQAGVLTEVGEWQAGVLTEVGESFAWRTVACRVVLQMLVAINSCSFRLLGLCACLMHVAVVPQLFGQILSLQLRLPSFVRLPFEHLPGGL